MYRLLKVKKSYFCTAFAECAESQYSSPLRTCSLCTKYFTWDSSTYFRLRGYHTSLETVQRLLKKKKTFRITKTASELLSVTEISTQERTATVTKLKPKHISRLVEQPETSLDQLHRLKFASPRKEKVREGVASADTAAHVSFGKNVDVAPIYQNRNFTGSTELQSISESDYPTHSSSETGAMDEKSDGEIGLPDEIHNGMANPHLQDSLDECDDSAVVDPSPSSDKEEGTSKKFKATKAEEWTSWLSKFKQLEMDYKEQDHTQKTRARLQILVNCGSTNKAEAMLRSVKRGPRSVKFIRGAGPLYDTVLEGLAQKGDLKRTLSLIQTMDNKHVEMTLKTFTFLFECLARNMTDNNDKIIEEYMKSMEQRGFKLDDIFLDVYFVRDQREMVLAAIRRIRPDYNPPVVSVDDNYHNGLLKDINNKGTQSYVTPAKNLIQEDAMVKLVDEQVKNERNGYVRIPNIWCQDSDSEMARKCKTLQTEVLEKWEKCLQSSVLSIHKAQTNSSPNFDFTEAVLRTLSVREVVKIMLQEISLRAETSELFSPPFSFLKKRLGEKVKEKYELFQMTRNGVMDKRVNLYQDFCREYLNEKQSSNVKNTRHLWSNLVAKDQEGPSHTAKQPNWPTEDLMSVGSILYSCLLKDCKINVNLMTNKPPLIVPAFYTVFRSKNRRLHEELKPHPVVTQLFRAVNRKYLTMDVDMVPMVSPPVPWTSFNSGAHLLRKVSFIRSTPVTDVLKGYVNQRLKETPNENYYPCYDSLNQLGSIPWKVNPKVLDVVLDVFRSGGSDELTVPFAPTEGPAEAPVSRDLNPMERSLILKERAIARRRKAENYALWCEALYRLSLAHHYRNRVIWLPHNMDFRGRVYPVAPYLQHMSGDMARSLLCFAKGEPLGRDGLNWLKIHLVNLTGLKKRDSIAERLEFANAMLPEIIDSAKNPLNGRKWWMESEEPWQTLAVCFEIVEAIESGDPENYIGHFPVHQDGSCNGLQHYAALGRDAAGARSVNLAPEDKPQDVYSCVAEIVERYRARDAAQNVTVAQELEGFIKRKVIKQTVMTTVYGVTRFGARLQIAKQLNAMKDFNKDKVWAASLYLTSKTFESLNEMFTSTKEIQSWLTDSAQLISQVRHECVEWVTPLGLPVIQPYSKPPSQNKKAKSLQKLVPTSVERPNVMKQRNAFPPNFIHSLDSTHMMLTGLHCERAAITYVSVHDCFWVHPRNVNAMNKICREQFVALHSEPILEDLSKFFQERYCFRNACSNTEKAVINRILTTVPPRGTFDLREVLESVYFFS